MKQLKEEIAPSSLQRKWRQEAEDEVNRMAEQLRKDILKANALGFHLGKLPGGSLMTKILFHPGGKNSILLEGFTFGQGYGMYDLPDDWEIQESWSDEPYRIVAVNKSKLMIYTYCEGDLSLEIFKHKTAFNQGWEQANIWYAENR